MGIFRQFATNKQAEREGVGLTYEANADGSIPTLLVARVRRNSIAYQAVFERVTRPYKDRLNNLTPEEDTLIMQKVFLEVGLKGWQHIRLPEGVAGIGRGDGAEYPGDPEQSKSDWLKDNAAMYDIPFSKENALALFSVLHDMWLDAAERATDPDTYRIGDLEAMAKN